VAELLASATRGWLYPARRAANPQWHRPFRPGAGPRRRRRPW